MNGSVEIRDRYNARVARRHVAICCSAYFRGLQQFFKNVIECFRNLPARIVLSDPLASLVHILLLHGLPVKRFSTFKSFKTDVPSRGKLEPEHYISVVGVYTEAALNFCARPKGRIISIY
jgi:hypothetical protein